ncbi:hypothetical protein [Microbulbifer sp. S227A]|uniref:hypothetical protein n=1 Tax=Microbulbifer sp. S227A TaxID=3415131 RepID=UPI003C7DE955
MNKDTIQIEYAAAGWRRRLDCFFAEQGQGFNAGLISQGRLHQLMMLEALSDAELGEIGLRRGDIPAFVFADLIGAVTGDA